MRIWQSMKHSKQGPTSAIAYEHPKHNIKSFIQGQYEDAASYDPHPLL
jgi:hypothetical protein